jgi:formylglycine-generating enzyme required for sulfatase activity
MANFSQPYGKPMPVGSYSVDKNVDYGTMDMAGNVAEWCYDVNNNPIVRGGSWKDNATFLNCASRRNYSADVKREIIGFRIVLVP